MSSIWFQQTYTEGQNNAVYSHKFCWHPLYACGRLSYVSTHTLQKFTIVLVVAIVTGF